MKHDPRQEDGDYIGRVSVVYICGQGRLIIYCTKSSLNKVSGRYCLPEHLSKSFSSQQHVLLNN